MKKVLPFLLAALVGGCATAPAPKTVPTAPTPPMPPGMTNTVTPVKKAAAKKAAVRTMSIASPTFTAFGGGELGNGDPVPPVTTSYRIKTWVVETDGFRVTNTTETSALVFTCPNPTKGPYTISASPDLFTWLAIWTSTGDDPIILYDFTWHQQAKHFYKFKVDAAP